MKIKRHFAFLLLVCFCSAQVLPQGVYLTDAEMASIKQELKRMSADTMRLREELRAQRQISGTLLETSERLQERLESVLTRLEISEASLEKSEKDLSALLSELAVLRTEYILLWESWTMQKNETHKWKRIATAGWISAVIILGGGIIWGLMK